MSGSAARRRLPVRTGFSLVAFAALAAAHVSRAGASDYILEFAVKPVTDTVEFCQPVEVEFTLTNAGDQPFDIHLPSVTHSACSVKCSWGGGGVGGSGDWIREPPPEEEWRRLAPGESFTVRAPRPRLGTVGLGDVAATFTYEYHRGSAFREGADPYTGALKARMRYRITDSALLRELRAEQPDLARVKQDLDHVIRLAETPEYRGGQITWVIEQCIGQDVVDPVGLLSAIAADPEVYETTRAWAVRLLTWARPVRNESLNAQIITLLSGLLSEDSPQIRVAVMHQLADADPHTPHLDLILPMADDENVKVRQAALSYLARFSSDERTWPHIERMLGDPSADVRNGIERYGGIKGLREHPELLVKCLLAQDDGRRDSILTNMGNWVIAEDMPWMLELMRALSPEQQAKLVQAARQMPGPERAELLGQAVVGPHGTVHDAALSIMEGTLDQAYAEPLEVLIALGTESEKIRAQAILDKLNEAAPLPDVRAIMAEVLSPDRSADSLARRRGARASSWGDAVHLFAEDDPAKVPQFRKLLEHQAASRRAAACDYLGRMRDQASFRGIAALTQDPDPAVRRTAAEALGRLRNPEALPYLVKLVTQPDRDVTDAALRALRSLPGSETTEALRDLYVATCRENRPPIDGDLLDAYVARKGSAATPDLIDAFELPLSGHACFALQNALFRLSGRRIEGDYESPEDRKRLQKEWREWWSENGADVKRGPWEPRPALSMETETSYCGKGIVIEWARHSYLGNQIEVNFRVNGEGNVRPHVIQAGNGTDGPTQYVLYQKGREIWRGEVVPPARSGRHRAMHPSSVPTMVGMASGHDSVSLDPPPGDYEMGIEVWRLCTEWGLRDVKTNSWGRELKYTKAEMFTLTSNRVPLTIHEPTRMTPDSIEMLARAMAEDRHQRGQVELSYVSDRGKVFHETVTFGSLPWQAAEILGKAGMPALASVLAHTDAYAPTFAQLTYLKEFDDPRARAIVEKARASQDENVRRAAAKPTELKPLDELVALATAPVESEGWHWHESGDALVALDGRLGPEHKHHTQALIRELAERLVTKPDHRMMRMEGPQREAFRTAFFLGRIGDPAAIDVLRQTRYADEPSNGEWRSNTQRILLRWYGAAAWKLVEVQNLPEPERSEQLETWVHHCFSSQEELLMARTRLLPYLADLLGNDRESVFHKLAKSLTDPWMKSDAEQLARHDGQIPNPAGP